MRDTNSRTQELRWDAELFLCVWEELDFLPSFVSTRNLFFKVSLGRTKDKRMFMQYSKDIIQGYS